MYRVLLAAIIAVPLSAQQYQPGEFLELLKTAPGETIHEKIKALDAQGIRLSNFSARKVNVQSTGAPLEQRAPQADGTTPLPRSWYLPPQRPDKAREEGKKVLENLKWNRTGPNSYSNSTGASTFSPESINNLYGPLGIPYSPFANQPATFPRPETATPNGEFFGRYGASRYDLNSGSISRGPSFPGPRNPYNSYSPNLPATPQTPAMPRFSAIPQR